MQSPWFLALDLTGTFAFALNGALTAIRLAKLDLVGVLVLGIITAMGGGIIRDIFIDSLPPTTFNDWRYLTVATAGGLVAFALSKGLDRLAQPIHLLDAAGLALFAVTGASKALDFGVGAGQAVILGAVTGVGGGTLRDVLIGRVPVVLRSELYAIPALVGATVYVIFDGIGAHSGTAALTGAIVCFGIRVLGTRYGWNAPTPPGVRHD